MNSIKIAIADDHPMIAEGIRNMLRYDPEVEVVATYYDGGELLSGLRQLQPDLLLLDINMPGQQGDELARIITQEYPRIFIIALTNLNNNYYIKTMLQYGVSGYLLKTIRKEELKEAIRQVCSGKTYLDDTVRQKMAEEKLNVKKQAGAAYTLTSREKEVLRLIVENYTSREIGEKLHISKRTADHHRENILFKLGVKNISGLAKKAIELGLIQI